MILNKFNIQTKWIQKWLQVDSKLSKNAFSIPFKIHSEFIFKFIQNKIQINSKSIQNSLEIYSKSIHWRCNGRCATILRFGFFVYKFLNPFYWNCQRNMMNYEDESINKLCFFFTWRLTILLAVQFKVSGWRIKVLRNKNLSKFIIKPWNNRFDFSKGQIKADFYLV